MSDPAAKNTNRELYREPHDDHVGAWDDKLFVTEHGGGIGIDVAGRVFVKSLKEWHALAAKDLAAADREVERIMSMTDAEIIAEVGGQAEAERIAAECRGMFERAFAGK